MSVQYSFHTAPINTQRERENQLLFIFANKLFDVDMSVIKCNQTPVLYALDMPYVVNDKVQILVRTIRFVQAINDGRQNKSRLGLSTFSTLDSHRNTLGMTLCTVRKKNLRNMFAR